MKRAAIVCVIGSALLLQGCVATAVAGAAVGATGAVIGTTAKGVGAVGRAVIPGDKRDNKQERRR